MPKTTLNVNNTQHTFLMGDALEVLRGLPDNSVHTTITSPPYFRVRTYDVEGQIGLEEYPEEYIQKLVDVFMEVYRITHPSGTLWINIEDSYVVPTRGPTPASGFVDFSSRQGFERLASKTPIGCKNKDLIGIPWILAMELRNRGWYLRRSIIWQKTHGVPESVKDRPVRSHAYVFLLAKSARYFYDEEAIKEPAISYEGVSIPEGFTPKRKRRDVWTIAPEGYKNVHTAVFPRELVDICLSAGTSEFGCCSVCGAMHTRKVELVARLKRELPIYATVGWEPTCKCGAEVVPCTVLDPFGGSGTTSVVAAQKGRHSIYVDLKEDYVDIALKRINAQVID